ncbi:class I SAM-dependent methyltransferase [Sorangium sp. So ce1389]|uniref:class I SAM-dependent methyltransferase n=1 Tax=Sorangium sp. So ce1389 TaxID=3133336 RepID=UPI003F643538
MQHASQLVRSVYDRIAERYDDRWGRHMRSPQDRLTAGLGLSPGARCVDLGCGTGSETVEMLRQVAPGEVIGVDCSEEMLQAARARAAAAGLKLSTRCAEAESFLGSAETSSFDIVTLRFCLAYLDWRSALPRLGRILRPGGRAGILTNLSSSTPQAYAIYCRMTDELDLDRVKLPVPDRAGQVSELLQRGGLCSVETWTHRFRLWFDSGAQVAGWLQESGFVTHAALREFPPEVLQPLCDEFAARLEVYREPEGIPLDFELAGVIAARP